MKYACSLISLFALLFLSPALAVTTTDYPAPSGSTDKMLIFESSDQARNMAPLILGFQQQNPDVSVVHLQGTTNEVGKDATGACSKNVFTADLILSSSVDQQVKLVNEGCARPLSGKAFSSVPDWAKWRSELFGVSYEPIVTVYNKKLWPQELPAPINRFAIVDMMRQQNRLFGQVGMLHIEQSGIGYLLAIQDSQQAGTYGRLIEAIGRQNVRLYCCTQHIMEDLKNGTLLLGYNILGSYALSEAEANPDLGIILPTDYTLFVSQAAFVPKSAKEPRLAQDFLEFILSEEGRQILYRDLNLYSILDGPQKLLNDARFETRPETSRPITLSPSLLVGLDQMKRWQFLKQWRASVITPEVDE